MCVTSFSSQHPSIDPEGMDACNPPSRTRPVVESIGMLARSSRYNRKRAYGLTPRRCHAAALTPTCRCRRPDAVPEYFVLARSTRVLHLQHAAWWDRGWDECRLPARALAQVMSMAATATYELRIVTGARMERLVVNHGGELKLVRALNLQARTLKREPRVTTRRARAKVYKKARAVKRERYQHVTQILT